MVLRVMLTWLEALEEKNITEGARDISRDIW